MTYADGEYVGSRGYGFPFIYLANDPATSLYKIIDLRHLIADLIIYFIFSLSLLIILSSILRRPIYPSKRTYIVISCIALFSIISFIPCIYFSSLSEIEYTPAQNSVQVKLPFFS
ncbi:MAG: hypothetical protein E6772_12965 [Dysgonomonas sp.]|nr:hypothetical protein [Dysgonomonas sp.]